MEPEEIAGGRYRVEAVLGQGGTATVYRVQDTVLDVQRAVKILSGSLQVRRALRRRLYAEAKAMARLEHPNILRLYDIGQDGDRDYVVMELAEGGTLGQLLTRQGPIPPYEALQFILQILSALAIAHDHGIVHRDVKPENVLLNQSGTALLADFGIALLAKDTSRATQMGVTMGSLAYMPPEQRLDARSVGTTADVYAVGATLYNLLTDENPIDLFTASESSPRWQDIPDAMLALLRKATQIEPSERYSDAREMAQAVLNLLSQVDIGTPPLRSRPEKASRGVRQVDQTFILPEKKALTSPGKVATDAAIEFLTAIPLNDPTINPTLAPEALLDTPYVASPRPWMIASAILMAGLIIGVSLAVPRLMRAPVQDTPSQASMPTAQPEAAEPGTAMPETVEPGTAEPGTAEPGTEEPETEEPGTAEPETAEPETAEPETAEPGTAAPEAAEPRAAEPEAAKPETAEPETAEPEAAEPETAAVAMTDPTESPETAPSADGLSVAGRWEGSQGGQVFELTLSGSSSQLSGSITVSMGPNTNRTPVRGRLDQERAVLHLTAYDDGTAIAEYELALAEGGQRLLGQATSGGNIKTISLKKK
jgi:serine/threonine-protein kinase